VDRLFSCVATWLAPILCFTSDEAWATRYGEDACVHLEPFAAVDPAWRDDALAERWETVKRVRRIVTGALELERAAKRLGSSLEAAPIVHIADAATRRLIDGLEFDEVCIVSAIETAEGDGPAEAFRLEGQDGIAVVPRRAGGIKCARSWRYFDPATADPEYPDITPRDAKAMREWRAAA
jgi:isoleucyl-tRNA synthetase